MSINVLVLAGDGINCEKETAWAFELAGASPKIIHINDLLQNKTQLQRFQILALPGGFSFGDELGSGQILALKIKHQLSEEFNRFVADQRPIIGICNGFQVLARLGVLPGIGQMALAPNESGGFIDNWVELSVNHSSVCKWSSLIEVDAIELPIRHGEGRVVLKNNQLLEQLQRQGQIPFCYRSNVNGSIGNIAGVCDPTGMILGMMPHPEAYLFEATYRSSKDNMQAAGAGQGIFKSIVHYLQ